MIDDINYIAIVVCLVMSDERRLVLEGEQATEKYFKIIFSYVA